MCDREYAKIITEGEIKIGYIMGSDTVLFIKTGQGGTIHGYNGKYIDLALTVNERYGYSVFVSETHEDDKNTFEREMQLVKGCFDNNSCYIYYLGLSKGGLIGCWYCADDDMIERTVVINAPLMINYYSKTLPGIKRLAQRLTLVYGSSDPSFKYLPFVEKYADVRVIPGADHNLVGSPLSLFDIVEKYLIER